MPVTETSASSSRRQMFQLCSYETLSHSWQEMCAEDGGDKKGNVFLVPYAWRSVNCFHSRMRWRDARKISMTGWFQMVMRMMMKIIITIIIIIIGVFHPLHIVFVRRIWNCMKNKLCFCYVSYVRCVEYDVIRYYVKCDSVFKLIMYEMVVFIQRIRMFYLVL
jgi:hypothetical protein